jgi:hypothetical protein
MDNITIRFTDVSFDLDKLKLFLKTENARESFKPDGVILFARKVGKHKECWQFRLDTQNRNILCSGGPTKTFFGFNAWVSLNLPVQMKTLVGILSRKLEQIGGVKLSTKFGPAVHRVEITNLYRFKSLEEIAEAEIALYSSLVLRYPKNVMISGASMEVPGMIRVGLNKSATTLRIYPEDLKFDARPKHISHERWRALCEELKFCLRVECIFDSTQLKAGDLDLTEKWNNLNCLKKLVEDRMSQAGLRNLQPQSYEKLDAYLAETKQTKVHAAILRWKSGAPLDVNGTWNSAQKVAKSMGFDLTKPFAHQRHLAHGYEGRFDASEIVELSEELRNDEGLSERWWEKTLLGR